MAHFSLKEEVKSHWENETCGIKYGSSQLRKNYFDQISDARYRLEPYISDFAEFKASEGKRILEIGIGAGSDFINWVAHSDHATGIDLTESAINLTNERLTLNNFDPSRYTLMAADVEALPFKDKDFDIVYSWGVLHHTPDTQQAFREACRVLKPGGRLKAMIYHVPSWTAIMLWAQHALLKGKLFRSLKDIVYHHLESPGTKAYSVQEAKDLLIKTGFTDIKISLKLGLGDLLTIKPSKKYQAAVYKIICILYPRWLAKLFGDRLGNYLLIDAVKA
jgi:ubiquinone/menaquinone biosynthesis C-methylase UbiE